MKLKNILCSTLALALLAGCASERHECCHAKLESQAKVSKEMASATALAQVPNGTVKEGELEKEHGKLIWSFDITTPDSKDITEIAVDAITGQVISSEKETPEDQAKEAAEDTAKAKKHKEDKD
ncbi:MAG: hypothetical protein QOD03_285 [Verrucomicrobiota bacterium]|jgi:hypothetical protein